MDYASHTLIAEAMPRGMSWNIYDDDIGNSWVTLVDADEALDPARGWEPATLPFPPTIPRGWHARMVYGFDADGHYRTARVANLTCDLWTGAVGTFDLEADGVLVPVTVVGKIEERRPGPR